MDELHSMIEKVKAANGVDTVTIIADEETLRNINVDGVEKMVIPDSEFFVPDDGSIFIVPYRDKPIEYRDNLIEFVFQD